VRWLFSAIPYVLAAATIAYGGVDLYRKRNELRKEPLRRAVLALFILIGALTLLSLYHENDEKQKSEHKAEHDIETLKHKVDNATESEKTAIEDQKNNTTVFIAKFGQLSTEVDELKHQVATAELQKKLASVQAELQKTQKAMAPAPKAKLSFTFVPFVNPPIRSDQTVAPVTDVSLPVAGDGSVHVEFTVLNLTQANALNIFLTLGICGGCKFAKEPEGFTKQPGDLDTQRWRAIAVLHEAEHLPPMSVDIVPPSTTPTFTMGIEYRCDTCSLDKEPTLGTVHVLRAE
jgi:hypothetical protein